MKRGVVMNAQDRLYTRNEARRAVDELLDLVRERASISAEVRGFIEQHPWARRYLGRFEECARELRKMVNAGPVVSVDVSHTHRRMYRREMLIIFIQAVAGKETLFRFEMQDDGMYAFLEE